MRLFVICFSVWTLFVSTALVSAQAPSLADLVRRGQSEAALAMLQGLSLRTQKTPQMRYLKARLGERLQKPNLVIAALKGSRKEFPSWLQRDLILRLGEAYTLAGHCDRAAKLFEAAEIRRRSERRKLNALEIRCTQHDKKKRSELLETQLTLENRGKKQVVLVELMELYAERRRFKAALTLLKREAIEYPTKRSLKELRTYAKKWGRTLKFSVAERLDRSQNLLSARRYKQALEELKALRIPKQIKERRRFFHLRGMALYKLRDNYLAAAKVLDRAARLRGRTAASDAFHAARAWARADRNGRAIVAMRAFIRKYPRDRRVREALYLKAWLELKHRGKSGEKSMERLIRRQRIDEWSRKALWQLSLRMLRQGRYWKAERYLKRYVEQAKSELERGQAGYWHARVLERTKRPKDALEAYQKVIREQPLHWYGVLSETRIRRLGGEGSLPWQVATSKMRFSSQIDWLPDKVKWYWDLGLDADAISAMKSYVSRLRLSSNNLGKYRKIAAFYLQAAAYREAYRLANRLRRLVVERSGSKPLWWWQAAYPMPWPEYVHNVTHQQRVSPALIYAVMRQESGYFSRAQSPADARGLLQLIPATGRRLARKLEMSFEDDDLYEPKLNILLGTKELQSLIKRYDGKLARVLAGYNAGVRRTNIWVKQRGKLELDMFVERVPFRETRNYIRRVLSHFSVYRYLYFGEWPPQSFENYEYSDDLGIPVGEGVD